MVGLAVENFTTPLPLPSSPSPLPSSPSPLPSSSPPLYLFKHFFVKSTLIHLKKNSMCSVPHSPFPHTSFFKFIAQIISFFLTVFHSPYSHHPHPLSSHPLCTTPQLLLPLPPGPSFSHIIHPFSLHSSSIHWKEWLLGGEGRGQAGLVPVIRHQRGH